MCVCSFPEVCVFATKQKRSRNLTSAVYITLSILNYILFNNVLIVYLTTMPVSAVVFSESFRGNTLQFVNSKNTIHCLYVLVHSALTP